MKKNTKILSAINTMIRREQIEIFALVDWEFEVFDKWTS